MAANAKADQKKRVGMIGSGWYGKVDLLGLIQVAPGVVSQGGHYFSQAAESGRGLPHSKTLRVFGHIGERASVLEQGSL